MSFSNANNKQQIVIFNILLIYLFYKYQSLFLIFKIVLEIYYILVFLLIKKIYVPVSKEYKSNRMM